MYLEHGRYTWRHDSVLNFIAKSLSVLPDCLLYADLATFLSPSVITGNSFLPDLVLLTNGNIIYILWLTIGFERNIKINSDRKASKCYPLRLYSQSMIKSHLLAFSRSFGTICSSSQSFVKLLKSLGINDNSQKHILAQLINITIRCTYYIFCCRNKP